MSIEILDPPSSVAAVHVGVPQVLVPVKTSYELWLGESVDLGRHHTDSVHRRDGHIIAGILIGPDVLAAIASVAATSESICNRAKASHGRKAGRTIRDD